MGTLQTVMLRYRLNNRIKYQYCAELLRFTGIFVWEYCREVQKKEQPDSDESEDFDETYTVAVDLDKMLETFGDEEPEWADLADRLFAEISAELTKEDSKIDGSEFQEAFPDLKNIFEKYRLFWAAVTLQYYHIIQHEPNPRVEAAGKDFEEAVQCLEKICSQKGGQGGKRHLRYAWLYCQQKANLGRRFCGNTPLVYANVLAEKCRELAAEYPDFYNARVLAGLSLEIAEDYNTEAIDDFMSAAEVFQHVPYMSSVYYWIGKRCEKDDARAEIMEMAYKLGYQIDPKYRLSYKMAMVSEKKQNWKDALAYYSECIAYLLLKFFYLDPLEQEYHFKATLRIVFIGLTKAKKEKMDMEKIYKLLKLLEDFRNTIDRGVKKKNRHTGFYFDLYGEEAPAYIEDLLKRLNPRQMYQYLAETCSLLGKKEEAEKYSILYEKWKLGSQKAATEDC